VRTFFLFSSPKRRRNPPLLDEGNVSRSRAASASLSPTSSKDDVIMASRYVTNRPKQQARDQKLVDGLTKHSDLFEWLVIDGRKYSNSELIAELQESLRVSKAAVAATVAGRAAVKADADRRLTSEPFTGNVQRALHAALAGSVDMLADFGLKPRKVAVISPEDKQRATQRALATRAARHTMGPKQKQAIKG
jgi:hypothetical protein